MVAVPRRSLLALGGLAATSMASAGLAGCSAAPGVTNFLSYLGKQVAQGFGVTAGEKIAEGSEKLVADLVAELGALTDATMTGSPLYGYATDWDKPSPMRAMVAAAFQQGGGPSMSWQSHSALVNSEEPVLLPSVIALGAAMFAQEELRKRLLDVAAADRKAAASRIQADLRSNYAIVVWEKIEGDGDSITNRATFRAITRMNRNLEVMWDPTTEKTEQSRIQIREGLVVKGVSPSWDSTYVRGIPSHLIWDISLTADGGG